MFLAFLSESALLVSLPVGSMVADSSSLFLLLTGTLTLAFPPWLLTPQAQALGPMGFIRKPSELRKTMFSYNVFFISDGLQITY